MWSSSPRVPVRTRRCSWRSRRRWAQPPSSSCRLTWGEQLVKEIFDRVVALLLLVALSPLLLLLAVVARLSCGGVFERHTALGLGGRPFQALKFRTTRLAAGPAAEDDVT